MLPLSALLLLLSVASLFDRAAVLPLVEDDGRELLLLLEKAGAALGAVVWAASVAVKARCLSLEILRGRGCKGGGAALRVPLVIGLAGEPEVACCCCWFGWWLHAVRRRPHWLHRARGSRPPLSIMLPIPMLPMLPIPIPIPIPGIPIPIPPAIIPGLWLTAVASRLALTTVVVINVDVDVVVPPMTTSMPPVAVVAAAAAAAFAAAADDALVVTDPVILSR